MWICRGISGFPHYCVLCPHGAPYLSHQAHDTATHPRQSRDNLGCDAHTVTKCDEKESTSSCLRGATTRTAPCCMRLPGKSRTNERVRVWLLAHMRTMQPTVSVLAVTRTMVRDFWRVCRTGWLWHQCVCPQVAVAMASRGGRGGSAKAVTKLLSNNPDVVYSGWLTKVWRPQLGCIA